MITSKAARLVLFLITAFTGGYLLLLLAVPFLGFGWHLLHRSVIASNGCLIPVPSEFYVNGGAEQPTMWKHAFGIPLFKGPFGMIGIRPRSSGTNFNFANDFEGSSARMIAVARHEGLALRSQRTLSAATGKAFCFEFSKPMEKSDITVRCAIDDTPLLVIYGGDERFSPDFYAAVQGISRDGLKATASHP